MTRKYTREFKGNNLAISIDDYVVIDIETTGLDPNWDDIIEVGALRVSGGNVVDEFSSLVKPESGQVPSFISKLTGITNEMLADAPRIDDILPRYRDFIGDSVTLGHNVHFDINFLYDQYVDILNVPLSNDFVDTLRLSRKLFPEFEDYSLVSLIESFGIQGNSFHRSLSDCHHTHALYEKIKDHAALNNIDLVEYFKRHYKSHGSLKASSITTDKVDFDITHPLYGKLVIFTGKLEDMQRKEAMQRVVDLGGMCGDGINRSTNYLVLGNNDYCSTIKDGKSNKQKKAENLMLEGYDIKVISENVFYDMLDC